MYRVAILPKIKRFRRIYPKVGAIVKYMYFGDCCVKPNDTSNVHEDKIDQYLQIPAISKILIHF